MAAKSTNNDAVLLMLKLRHGSTLMPTTNSAYGSGDDGNFCDETSPLKPISSYAVEKVRVEQELMSREKFYFVPTSYCFWYVSKDEN